MLLQHSIISFGSSFTFFNNSCLHAGLLSSDNPSPVDYDWLCHLQYKMEPFPSIVQDPVELAGSSMLSLTRSLHSGLQQPSPCHVYQLGQRFTYGYEYCGPSEQLCITPATQRCFVSMMTALQHFETPVLYGHPLSGKSSTVQHLAKV